VYVATTRLRIRHRQQRVEQVLDAAEQLFSIQGYEATRIETIAESASVAPATVYNYFSTKPNLLMALALRHVHAALPERRAYLADLPENPISGIVGFERLLAQQAMRHLSRDCWRIILSAGYLEPGGKASRTGACLNKLIRQHYVQLIRAYQGRGRLRADIDPSELSNLIVGIFTFDFGQFVAASTGTVEDLIAIGVSKVRLILEGLTIAPRSNREQTGPNRQAAGKPQGGRSPNPHQ
jgi:AcrR family transcriptional regulator